MNANKIIIFILSFISIICLFISPLNVLSRDFILLFQVFAVTIGTERGWNLFLVLEND